MTHTEAIQAVRAGKRVQFECSLHKEESPASVSCQHLLWRTIACDYETDIVECASCGRQRVVRCDFDGEYA